MIRDASGEEGMHNNLHALACIAVDSAEYGGVGAHAAVDQSV